MSNETDIRVIRRGDNGEVGGNWWKTVLLLLAIVAALILYRNLTTNAKSENGNQGVATPAAENRPADMSPGRGPDGLYPLSAP